MEVLRYLHQLLHLHDCVIVPGLGGFVCSHKKCELSADTGFLHPARKTVAFNQNLSNNDGLMANYIAQKENLGFTQALNKVTAWSDALKARIEQGETVNIDGIGTMYHNEEKRLVFIPDATANFLPETYGLEAIRLGKSIPVKQTRTTAPAPEPLPQPEQIQAKAKEKPVKEKAAKQKPVKEKPAKRHRPVARFFRRVATVVLTLIVLFALFILQDFVFHSSFHKGSLFSIEDFYDSAEEKDPGTKQPANSSSISHQPQVAQPEALNAEPQSLENNTVAQSTVETSPNTSSNSDSVFYIIAGAYRHDANAEKMSRLLQQQGYTGNIIKQPGSALIRVGYGEYASRNEAEAQAVTIRNSEDNPDAWVLAIKK